jgi:hypothetical protein
MPFSSTALIGAKLSNVDTAADVVAMNGQPPHRIGTQVWGDDGKLYVYAKVNAGSISASTAVCTVNATTFFATSSGGNYLSPATAMGAGDYGWFAKTSV